MALSAPAPHPPSITPLPVHQYPPTYASASKQDDDRSPPPPFSELDDKDAGAVVSVREIMRTPSPTPTEANVLAEKTRTFDWRKIVQLLHWRHFTTMRGAWTRIAVLCIIAFFATFLAMQSKIEDALTPFSDWLRDTPGAWLVPIAVMVIISFPPLFGHELVGIICGDVWGVWLGFAIFGAGTVIGELANYLAFKWWCMSRGKKLEEKQLKYALYAQVVREGGLKVPVIMRFSLIPSHFSTAIFSTCGMNVWIFLASAILSLPKQLSVVYIGVSQNDSNTGNDSQTKGVKAGVIIITLCVTIFAMRYINGKVDQVKHRVVYARRKARQAKALAAASESGGDYADVLRIEVASASGAHTTLEGATTPTRRHFPLHPHGTLASSSTVPHVVVHAPSPHPQQAHSFLPTHPSGARTTAGVRGADVDLEMGMQRGRSLDTTGPAAAGGVTGARPPDGVRRMTSDMSAYGAPAGGRAMGGVGQAW